MLAFGLGVILVLIYLFTAIPNLDSFNALPEDLRTTSTIFDIGLWLGIIMIAVTALFAIGFGIWQFITNPKGSIKVLGGLAAVVIMFGIFYATSESETTGALATTISEFKITDTVSKLISAGIKTVFGLSAVSVAIFLGGELYNAFK